MNTVVLKRNFWLLFALGFILLVGNFSLIYLIYQKAAGLSQMELAQATVAQKEKDLAYLKNLSAQTQDGQKLILTYFTNNNDGGLSLLESLSMSAKTANVSLKINQADNKKGLNLDFTAGGSFTSLYQFIILVENLPYAVHLDSIHLTKNPSTAAGSAGWTGDFHLSSFDQTKP